MESGEVGNRPVRPRGMNMEYELVNLVSLYGMYYHKRTTEDKIGQPESTAPPERKERGK